MKAKPQQPDAPLTPVGYDRVSTQRQAEHGVMLEARSESIPAHCAYRGWKLTPDLYFTDPGRSGREGKKRPGFDAAMNAACRPGHVLVVDSLSRFVRSTIDADRALKRIEDSGAAIVIINLGIDTTTASGKLIYKIIAAVAEFESNQTSERISAARDFIYRRKGFHTMGAQRWDRMIVDGQQIPDHECLAAVAQANAVCQEVHARFGSWSEAAVLCNMKRIPTPAHIKAWRRGSPPRKGDEWTGAYLRKFCKPRKRIVFKVKEAS